MNNSPSHDAATQRGFVLLPVLGIIAVLIGLLLPAVQSAREAGIELQKYEATAPLGAKIVAEADATEALVRNLARALSDVPEDGWGPVIFQRPELLDRIDAVQLLQFEIQVGTSAFTSGPIADQLERADAALGRMLALLRNTEQSLFSHADLQRN